MALVDSAQSFWGGGGVGHTQETIVKREGGSIARDPSARNMGKSNERMGLVYCSVIQY